MSMSLRERPSRFLEFEPLARLPVAAERRSIRGKARSGGGLPRWGGGYWGPLASRWSLNGIAYAKQYRVFNPFANPRKKS